MISEETPIKKNRLLTTMPKLKKEYSVHVEFMLAEVFPSNDWYNIFHATISGNRDVYGSRVPGIWIHYIDGNILVHIASSVNGEISYNYKTPPSPIQLKKWVTINISQTKVGDVYQYKMSMNGEVMKMANNTQPQEFLNVKIYISDPWFEAVPGYVRNVTIKGKV